MSFTNMLPDPGAMAEIRNGLEEEAEEAETVQYYPPYRWNSSMILI